MWNIKLYKENTINTLLISKDKKAIAFQPKDVSVENVILYIIEGINKIENDKTGTS